MKCCCRRKNMDAELMHAKACEYALERTVSALDAATAAALPLCALIARRFVGRGADYEDLYQVASMALVSALKAFDPSRGLKFSTYVTPTITGTVRNYLRDKGSVLRTPRGLKEQTVMLAKARESLTQRLRRDPTVRELSDVLSWPMARVLDVLAAQENMSVTSLDVPAPDGRMPAETMGFLDNGFENVEKRSDLKAALKKLSNEEKMLLALRFSDKLSQRETAQRLMLSQMQVSRMERRALQTLRKEMDGAQA